MALVGVGGPPKVWVRRLKPLALVGRLVEDDVVLATRVALRGGVTIGILIANHCCCADGEREEAWVGVCCRVAINLEGYCRAGRAHL